MLKGTRILAPSSQRQEALQKIHTSHLGMEKGIVIQAIAPYMPIRNKISITKGLVLKGTRILAPSSQRKEALQKIHTSHLGMEKGIVIPAIAPYMPIRNNVSITKGLVLKGTRILAPSSQRKEALQKIHTSHLGMEKGIVIPAIAPYMPNRNNVSITKGLVLKGTRILAPSSQRKEALQKIHTNHLGMEKGIVIPAIAPYMPIRNEISITKGLVLKGTRILAPSSQRKEALQKIHTSHLGMEKGIVIPAIAPYMPIRNEISITKVSHDSSRRRRGKTDTILPY